MLYERYDWESARLRCRLIHPRAHLIVIDDAAEQTAIRNYLISLPSKYLRHSEDIFTKIKLCKRELRAGEVVSF